MTAELTQTQFVHPINIQGIENPRDVNIHDFVKELKLNKTFTQKQCIVIENLYIYFENLMVYKVVIAIHPDMLKKAKKLGLESNNGYITIFFDNVKLDIKSLLPNVEKGRYIAIYNPNNADAHASSSQLPC